MDSLNLSIPRQHNYTDPTVERDLARLQDWLTNLPLMDVVETVRLVLGALEALNEQKLESDEQRFQFLDIYRATAQRLFVTLDPLHLRQLALTKAQRQQAIDGVSRLFLRIAEGYKLVVTALYESSSSGQPSPLLGLAINRALDQLSYALLDNYRFYRPVEPFVMAELHQLYRLARHYGFLNIQTEVEEAHPSFSTAAMYHTSMLLSLTDPFRLAEGEVGLLFDILMQHSDNCRIIPGNSWSGSGDGLFLIDLRKAEPPVPCTSLDPPVDVREPYLLDATVALAAIRERLAQTPEKVRMQSPEAMVLRRLLPEGSGADKRREQRHADGRWVKLLLGLGNIHSYLLFAANKAPAATRPPEPSPSRVLDASDSGMKLAWQEGGAGDARVGDLLGIVEAAEGGQQSLRLALIRSIRVYREGGMEAGVQLMHGGLGAVSCCVPDEPDTVAVRALFLPASEEEQFAATLITAKGLYAEDARLLIDVGGREVRVRAGRRVFDSPVFDRFEFAAE